MSNICAVKQQRFCKHFVMIIASGRHVIPLPEFITGDCAIMTTKFCSSFLAPYIEIFACSSWSYCHRMTLNSTTLSSTHEQVWVTGNLSNYVACARKRTGCQPQLHTFETWFINIRMPHWTSHLEMFVVWGLMTCCLRSHDLLFVAS